jgi:DNA-binding beta-propeller fold protein YncE
VRIDPDTHEVIATIPGVGAADIAVTSDAIWVAGASGDYVTFQRIDPATNQVARTVTWQLDPGSQVTDPRLVVVDGRLWGAVTTMITADDEFGELVEGGLYRITDDDRVELWTSLGRWPTAAAEAGGSVWVTDCFDGTLTQLDTDTGSVVGSPLRIGIPAAAQFDLFDPEGFTCPGPIAVVGDTLWIAGAVDGTLIPVYLDPDTAPGPTVTIPAGLVAETPATTDPPGPETTFGPDTTAVDTAPQEG